ncbi:hypothetical protein LLG39_15440, partial [bacterium]|nr:hypothetical protein [bacterium]
MVAVIAVLAVLFGAYVGLSGGVSSGLLQTAERQASIADPLDPQNLSGRTGIWHDSIAFLNMDPVRWIVGAGPGSVAQYGYNAHCLYLHITMEAGILGLMLFLLFSYRTVSYLKRFERGAKPLMWMTIAFLISALTQETFYPVPAFQHFLGLYLCSIAIVLSIGSTVQTTKPSYSEAD